MDIIINIYNISTLLSSVFKYIYLNTELSKVDI